MIPSFRGKVNLPAKVGSWELGSVESSNGRLSACLLLVEDGEGRVYHGIFV